jgi:hypothetical protein
MRERVLLFLCLMTGWANRCFSESVMDACGFSLRRWDCSVYLTYPGSRP